MQSTKDLLRVIEPLQLQVDILQANIVAIKNDLIRQTEEKSNKTNYFDEPDGYFSSDYFNPGLTR
tara:strand:+ start:3796 stop:3990 length:195 start_codon:yes stop_codon:yes gene_type:complete